MGKHVVFISLPMSGIPDEVVSENIECAKQAYMAITKRNIRNTVFVHNLNAIAPEYVPPEKKSAWYLGQAIERLSICDEAFFFTGWKKARGCRIEHEVCVQYDIPIIAVEREGN